ncbi:MAG: sigma-54 dependent transcriptional regulator [Desulfobacteraceae bacterium]|nr:sigma-54 dependent transcriptional regulator [Desulfobacteraceae bacterium]
MADILIIDDDRLICDILVKMMGHFGHESRFALTGKEGLELAKNGRFDIVFLDVKLPDANGLDLIKTIKVTPSSPEIIIITGESSPDGAEMAINSGAWNYLCKPFLRQELNLQVSRALQFRKEKGNISTPGILKRNGLIGESKGIRSCLEQASVAAYSDTPVLISGEPGTGKALFAKTIHLNSGRGEKNFVVVDCSAVTESIFQGMLFGLKKGGKGAGEDKTGLIKQADKGTLFLNEISELPLPVQRSLLRVMVKRAFIPAGEKTEEPCNFRVIASTSKDLEALSEKRKFQKGLLFRLKGICLHLPPLRRIRGDIIKLALYYLDQHCRTYKIDTKGISPECLDILTAYKWPGNIGEMANAMDKAVATAKNEPTLYSIHLPSYIRAKTIKKILMPDSKSKNYPLDDDDRGKFPLLSQVLENTEKDYLNAVLSHTGQNLKEACRISGISKFRMYSKLQKYMLN